VPLFSGRRKTIKSAQTSMAAQPQADRASVAENDCLRDDNGIDALDSDPPAHTLATRQNRVAEIGGGK
jgi:hypothetical protein